MKKTIIACMVTLFLCVICLTGCDNLNFYPTNETGDNTNHQADVPDDPMTTVSETVEETEAETEDEYGILMKDRIYVSINNIEDGRKPITYDDVKDKSLYKMIPEFEQIPDDSDWWTHDVWRQFIRKVEEEDLGIESEDYRHGRRDVF